MRTRPEFECVSGLYISLGDHSILMIRRLVCLSPIRISWLDSEISAQHGDILVLYMQLFNGSRRLSG